jgi:Secretion system C-terminal sorting domain
MGFIKILPGAFRKKKNAVPFQPYKIEIHDAGGKEVYNAEVSSGTVSIPQLNSGIYFLTLTNTTTRQAKSVSLFKSK